MQALPRFSATVAVRALVGKFVGYATAVEPIVTVRPLDGRHSDHVFDVLLTHRISAVLLAPARALHRVRMPIV